MTSKYETTVGKRDGQWRASTTIPLEGTQRELDIVTSKDGRGNITARATVYRIEGSFRTYLMGFGSDRGDFSRRVLTLPCRRVTEHMVMEVHLRALDGVDALLEAVKAHYARQGELDRLQDAPTQAGGVGTPARAAGHSGVPA